MGPRVTRLMFPPAVAAMVLFVGLLATSLLGLKIGQIDVGGHRTVTLRGNLRMIAFTYKRPLWGRIASSNPNALYPPSHRWHGQGIWSNFMYVHYQVPVSNEPYWFEYFSVGAPSWLVLLLSGALPVWYFGGPYRRHRIQSHRHKHGLCLVCGYSLTGNTSGFCPECGAAIGPAPNAAAR